MALIGNDVIVRIGIGETSLTGRVYAPLSTQDFKGVCKSIHIHEASKKIDTSSMGDYVERNRFHKISRTLELDSVVPRTGYSLRKKSGGAVTSNDPVTTYVGCYIRVETAAGPFTDGDAWVGIIESWDWTAGDGSEQVEKITIDLTPDY